MVTNWGHPWILNLHAYSLFFVFLPPVYKKPQMGKFEKVKSIWNKVKSEWKTRYRLVFSNEDTHEQEFVIRRITIQRMFVVAVIGAFVIILLTTLSS